MRASGIQLSLAMIVKNEARCLARCLRSVRAVVDEIIVADTGSTDDTVKIAGDFGAKVIRFEWINDFAAARNAALAQATGDLLGFRAHRLRPNVLEDGLECEHTRDIRARVAELRIDPIHKSYSPPRHPLILFI